MAVAGIRAHHVVGDPNRRCENQEQDDYGHSRPHCSVELALFTPLFRRNLIEEFRLKQLFFHGLRPCAALLQGSRVATSIFIEDTQCA